MNDLAKLVQDQAVAMNTATMNGYEAGVQEGLRRAKSTIAHTPTKDALIADLVEALEDALEFMEGYEDVGDGDYGQPVPNRAMQVCTQIRSALARAKT